MSDSVMTEDADIFGAVMEADTDIDDLLGNDQPASVQIANRVKPSFRPIASAENLWGLTVDNVEVLMNNPRRVVVDIVRLFLANKTPITAWGPVGSRKTRTIQSFDREVDENGVHYQVITIQPSTEDPTVIHGMMFTSLDKDGVTTVMQRSLPSVVDQIIKYYEETGGLTILYLDEMTTCMPAQQHALLGLMTHGTYGDKDISPYITIIMAANPEGTVSTVNDLGEQVMNRGGHVAWYGDVELFMEEWGSGFGSPERAPDRKTAWFVKELINQAPNEAFRNPTNWDPDTLVPYDRMEHTERSVTELAKLLTLINDVMKGANSGVRHFYIVEVTRALLGNKWAERAANVAAMESDSLSPEYIIQRMKSLENLSIDTSPDDFDRLMTNASYPLYRLPDNSLIRQDQASVLMAELMESIEVNGFSRDAYLASWAFALSAPTSGQVMGHHSKMVELLALARRAVNANILDGASAVPKFVSQDVRNALRAAVANASSGEGANA